MMDASGFEPDIDSPQFFCRLCLEENLDAFGSLTGRSICKDKTNAEILEICTGIKIPTDDSLPQFVCYKCLAQLNATYNFMEACKKSYERLKERPMIKKIDDKNSIHLLKPKSPCSPILNIPEGFFKTEIDFDGPTIEPNESFETLDPLNSGNTSENEEQGLTKEQIEKYKAAVAMRKRKLKMQDFQSEMPEVVQCKECLGYFRTEKGLMFHIMKVHQVQKSGLECKLCTTILKNKHSYRLHMKTVHSTQSAQCAICFKNFSCQQYLDDHKKIHQENASQRYTCDICKKPFSSMKSLYRHKGKIHMKIPPLKKSSLMSSLHLHQSSPEENQVIPSSEYSQYLKNIS